MNSVFKVDIYTAALLIRRITDNNMNKRIIGKWYDIPESSKGIIKDIKNKANNQKNDIRHHPYLYQWDFQKALKYVMINWDEAKYKEKIK